MGIRVGLDFGAGTQSARHLIEDCGFLYIPLDTKRWVFSARLGEWVENVVLDLSKGTGEPEDMWQRIRAAVLQQWGLALGAQLVTIEMLRMSPLCRNFSNADASNRDNCKGCGYSTGLQGPQGQREASFVGRKQCIWETSKAGRCISAVRLGCGLNRSTKNPAFCVLA